jgi:hypothetical protein
MTFFLNHFGVITPNVFVLWMAILKNKIVATSLFEDEKVNKSSFLRML